MEPPKRKITTNVVPSKISRPSSARSPTVPAVSSPSPIVIRAKVSSTARTRTHSTTSSPAGIIGSTKLNGNVVLRPQSHEASRRSPSPAKMVVRPPSPSKSTRPPSPSKLTSKPTHVVRTASRTALNPSRSDVSHRVHVSTVFGHADGVVSSASAPSTPLPQRPPVIWDTEETSNKVGPNSLRVKAKVSSLAKPAPPPLSTVISPPSPTSSRSTRGRAATVIRRPSSTFSATHCAASPFPQAFAKAEDAQLVPLPTSPPASTLSFSSHSSTSASSLVPTSDKKPPSSSHINHARRVSAQTNSLHMNLSSVDEQEPAQESPSPPPSPKRPLVARIRPGTRISGGGGDWSNVPNMLNGHDPLSYAPQQDDSSSFSDSSLDENDNVTRRPMIKRSVSQEREDEERAEAKSNRKIADLEITTRSLLVINASLEASKVRQAREIRELRRKLRETRLSMPPKQFQMLPEKERVDVLDEPSDQDEADAEGSECFDEEQGKDVGFQRVKSLVEELLAIGRNALAVPAPSLVLNHLGTSSGGNHDGEVLGWDAPLSAGGDKSREWKHGVAIGTRVLSAEEAKKWTGDGEAEEDGSQDDFVEGEEVERQLDSESLNDPLPLPC